MAKLLVNNLKTSPVHSAQHLHTIVCSAPPLGNPEVETLRKIELGNHPVPHEMQGKNQMTHTPRIFLENETALEHGSARMTPYISPVVQHLVAAVEQRIKMAHGIERALVNQQIQPTVFQCLDVRATVGVDGSHPLRHLPPVLPQPRECVVERHLVSGIEEES